MALILAPYNEAMRLGMGFNSYTQQLCCNDVVRLPNGRPATTHDLRDVNPKPAQGGPVADSGARSAILSSPEGTDMIKQKKMVAVGYDEQNEVSQVVSWKASFVDKVSDVTKNLNISGALKVKVDAIGEVEVSGHYIDDNAIKDSDATYDILVKVTNQRLEAPQVNKFCPIENLDPSRFNEVYGDCFISGFLEGGVFHAQVSIKKKDEKSSIDAGGQIKAGATVAGLDISGEIRGGIKSGKTSQDYSTTITVNWSGGGDIKPDSITEWNIKTLTEAAMDFPDKVAACPQWTYAILTKYSALRSFHEATVKGSPMDYENAGIYTNSLLDSYMDYKYIWSQIQERVTAVDKGLMRIEQLPEHPNMASYRDEFIKSHEERMERYYEAQKTLELVKKSRPDTDFVLEPPMKPNALVPYSADLFGLDAAKRDCRFEMIKIVKEINAVCNDPKVATDPTRIWQYVAPSIFRRLVPADKPIDERAGDVKAIKADVEERIRSAADRYRDGAGADSEESFLLSGEPVCDLEKLTYLRYGHLMEDWRIDSLNGQSTPAAACKPFNDLEELDKGYVVTNIAVWYNNQRIVGIKLVYQNGQVIMHGKENPSNCQFKTLSLNSDPRKGHERVNHVWLEAGEDGDGKAWVDSLCISTTDNVFVVEPGERLRHNRSFRLKSSRPKGSEDWDFKGFYGSFNLGDGVIGFSQLSPIWSRSAADGAQASSPPMFELAAWWRVLEWPRSLSDGLRSYLHWGRVYRFSRPCGDMTLSRGTAFNALDHITAAWFIKRVLFYFGAGCAASALSGIRVEYTNGKQLQHGRCRGELQIWEPPSKDNERISGLISYDHPRPEAPPYNMGIRFFMETTEEDKEDKGESPAEKTTAKPAAEPAKDAEATSESKLDAATTAPKEPALAETKGAEKGVKNKIITESSVWITRTDASREGPAWQWSSGTVSLNPAPKGSDEKWTIKGFMGVAGEECIETLCVVWAKY